MFCGNVCKESAQNGCGEENMLFEASTAVQQSLAVPCFSQPPCALTPKQKSPISRTFKNHCLDFSKGKTLMIFFLNLHFAPGLDGVWSLTFFSWGGENVCIFH